MRTLCIDRFEGNFAVCEELLEHPVKAKDIRYFGIEKNELPQGAAEGSVLLVKDDGTLLLDQKQTDARRAKAMKLQRNLWE